MNQFTNRDREFMQAAISDADGAGFNELTISNLEMKQIGGSGIEVDPGCLSDDNRAPERASTPQPI